MHRITLSAVITLSYITFRISYNSYQYLAYGMVPPSCGYMHKKPFKYLETVNNNDMPLELEVSTDSSKTFF